MDGFDVVVRVARLGLSASGEGTGMLELYVRRTADAYDIDVGMIVLPEQVVLQAAGPNGPRSDIVRVTPGIFRLDQVANLKRTLVAIESGLSADDACGRLDSIAGQRQRWPWWARILGVALFAAGFAPSVVATWGEVGAAAILGLLMGLLVVSTAGTKIEGLVPFLGAFGVTVLGLTVLSDLATRTGVTLLVIPALFIVVPGDTLSAAAGELLSGRLLDAGSRRPPRLILVLGGFFVLTVGGLGVRGVTAFFGGDPVSSLHDLADFGLQVPTVALALALGVVLSERWRPHFAD